MAAVCRGLTCVLLPQVQRNRAVRFGHVRVRRSRPLNSSGEAERRESEPSSSSDCEADRREFAGAKKEGGGWRERRERGDGGRAVSGVRRSKRSTRGDPAVAPHAGSCSDQALCCAELQMYKIIYDLLCVYIY